MVTIHKFNEQGQISTLPADSIHHLNLNNEDSSGTGLIWIDLEKSTIEEDETVFKKLFPIHKLTLEDISYLRDVNKKPHLPKVE